MPTIGLISDTHGFLDEKVFHYFDDCDEIWHAGDFGTKEVADKLKAFKKFRGVYGNIDGKEIRVEYPETQQFQIEGFRVFIIHIGGYPGKYAGGVKKKLQAESPDIFICGHSHILKIGQDKELGGMIYMNPGAAGKEGFHKIRTIVKFDLNNKKIANMKVIELGRRGR